MLADVTELDPSAWAALRKALNQRVVVERVRFVPSKVNRVWFVETDVRPVVVKRFLSKKGPQEFEMLLRARRAGLNVPFPLWMQDDVLVTQYVAGEGVELMIHKMFDQSTAESLGAWLANFHERMSVDGSTIIMGDAVPSNFINCDGEVYGVDLEDTRPGNPLDDVGQMAAAILGTEPYFTPIKYDLCMHMLKRYSEVCGTDIVDPVRCFVAKHLLLDAKRKPLFRRMMTTAARKIEAGWPKLR